MQPYYILKKSAGVPGMAGISIQGQDMTSDVAGRKNTTPVARSCCCAGVTILDPPEEIKVRETRLREGLWLSTVDISPAAGIRFRYEKRHACIDFGIVLAGDMRNSFRGASPAKREIYNSPGQGGIAFLPYAEGVVEIPAQRSMRILHVHMERQALSALLEGEQDLIPADFRRVVEGTATEGYFCQGEMDPAARIVACQLSNGPLPGMPGRLFLEGKALELISLQLAWLGTCEGRATHRTALRPADRERLLTAREILLRDPACPPALPELARQVGMGVNRLGAGFRELFGTTVYGQLREHQMQQARLLFEQGELNVSQVAWTVGYTNVSHFSAAFKKRFGVLPKTFLKSARVSIPLP